MSAAEKFVGDSRSEWIGWALDVLRRYAPDPIVDRDDARDLDEELDAIEHLDAEQFFYDEQCPSDGQFR